jgi:hypothetical protein
LCRAIRPSTAIPIHYEGWNHFQQSRDEIERDLAKAPADIRRRSARPFACADEDVLRPRRAVEEVPRLQAALLTLDEEDAFGGEYEEVLLHVLRVVFPVRLARI